MSFLNWRLAFLVSALAASVAGNARAATVTVDATDDIFAAGLTQTQLDAANLPNGGGTVPVSIAVTPGQTLVLTATGSLMCCVGGSPSPTTGPNGFTPPTYPTGNPFGTGSDITNDTGSSVGSFVNSVAFPLVGVFNTAGPEPIFVVGSSDTVVVPVGATLLYLGLPDANGFGGSGPQLAGYYSDNSGYADVTVNATPLPAALPMFAAGLGGLGLLGWRRKRKNTAAVSA